MSTYVVFLSHCLGDISVSVSYSLDFDTRKFLLIT
jgi:hypothetical protein